jgi:peptidoglycan hydrolase CwlO-like protein
MPQETHLTDKVADLTRELKFKDERIEELRQEIDENRDLIQRLERQHSRP